MNGKERNLSLFRKLSAYIMQDNQLHANLTVEEAMNVAANLKLSQKVQRNDKLSVVSIVVSLPKKFPPKFPIAFRKADEIPSIDVNKIVRPAIRSNTLGQVNNSTAWGERI